MPENLASPSKAIKLNPGGDCVIVYWKDHLLDSSLNSSSKKTTDSISSAISQDGIPASKIDSVSDTEVLNSESDNELRSNRLDSEIVYNDPFFAKLLKNADNYSLNNKSEKKKPRDVEDDYDVNDPFIDDSELLFMDGHAHSRLPNQRKNRVSLGPASSKNTNETKNGPLSNEQGEIVLDLELLDRPIPADFFVYYGILEDSDSPSEEDAPTPDINLPKNNNSIKQVNLLKDFLQKNPVDVVLKNSSNTPKIITSSQQKSLKRPISSLSSKSTKNNSQNLSFSQKIKTIPNYQSRLRQTIKAPETLEAELVVFQSKILPGVITNKNHFPYVLKAPLRKICVSSINLTLEYESYVLKEYPIPLGFRPSDPLLSLDNPYAQQNSNNILGIHHSSSSTSNKLSNHMDIISGLSANQITQLHDNQIISWESATDLVDISDFYQRLTSILPWGKTTLRKIIKKLLGKSLIEFKELQLKNIESCLAKKISESSKISQTYSSSTPPQPPKTQFINQNGPTPQHASNNKTYSTNNVGNKFVWNTVIRHLVHQYVKVFMEIHDVTVSPLETENSYEEKTRNQKLRRDAYLKILRLWPNNSVTVGIIGREYSYRKSIIANRMRKSLNSSLIDNKSSINPSAVNPQDSTPPSSVIPNPPKNKKFQTETPIMSPRSDLKSLSSPSSTPPVSKIKEIARNIEEKIIDLEKKRPFQFLENNNDGNIIKSLNVDKSSQMKNPARADMKFAKKDKYNSFRKSINIDSVSQNCSLPTNNKSLDFKQIVNINGSPKSIDLPPVKSISQSTPTKLAVLHQNDLNESHILHSNNKEPSQNSSQKDKPAIHQHNSDFPQNLGKGIDVSDSKEIRWEYSHIQGNTYQTFDPKSNLTETSSYVENNFNRFNDSGFGNISSDNRNPQQLEQPYVHSPQNQYEKESLIQDFSRSNQGGIYNRGARDDPNLIKHSKAEHSKPIPISKLHNLLGISETLEKLPSKNKKFGFSSN
ncbi:hypothetical protein AYI68_g5254 [Smittium mucronatum]|uniref:Ubinuclein middle domain-containing protein n=1 Tax=Smittium mucronatum TaxID=133383 RepID=A0A1R0GUT8_9FUNG|nr:hypothetical protein AYI68_g5254 [Smittium mucronatum]